MAELKIDTNKLVPIAVLVVAVLVGLGVWNRISALESRVADIDAAVAQLEVVHERVAELRDEVAGVEADVIEIRAARDDILRSICDLLGRDPRQCGVAPEAPEVPDVPPDRVP